MNTIQKTWSFGSLVLLSVGCASLGGAGESIELVDAASKSDVVRAFPGGDGVVAFIRNEFGVTLTAHASGVAIDASEKSPDDGIHYQWDANAATTFSVEAICARHANEYYVYGIAANGSPVLERWELAPWPTGSYHTERKLATSPIGTSVRSNPTTVQYSGPFIDPSQRAAPTLNRFTLTMPPGLGEVAEIEVDPEGRYLVFRTVDAQQASSLVQYEFSSGTLLTVATSASLPILADASAIRFLDTTGFGRLLCVWPADALVSSFLIDRTNDGVFESSMDIEWGADFDTTIPAVTATWLP